MASRISTINTELTGDPLTIGYAGMSDEAVATSLNDKTTGRTEPVPTLDSVQLYEAIETAEFDSLTTTQKAAVDRILGLGLEIDVTVNSKARAVLLDAFGILSLSRTAILAIVVKASGRGAELGVGSVTPSDVADARRL